MRGWDWRHSPQSRNQPAAGSITDDWVGGNGAWTDAADWAQGVPNATRKVLIDPATAAKVSIAASVRAVAASLTLDAGDVIALSGGSLQVGGGTGPLTVTAGATITGFGTLDGTIANDGALIAGHGSPLVVEGAVTGAGAATIDASATLDLVGRDAQNVAFTAASGSLQLGDPTGFGGTLEGLMAGDVIEIAGVDASATTATLNGTRLVVSEDGTIAFTFALATTYAGEASLDSFSQLAAHITTGNGSTMISVPGAGAIKLLGYTGGVSAADVEFGVTARPTTCG
jgi:fibronectin-binding autotransporter adhesin